MIKDTDDAAIRLSCLVIFCPTPFYKFALGCTPHYSSPEVHERESYGRSLDIWSIGCTVLEMITGKIPWTKSNMQLDSTQAIYRMCAKRETPLTFIGELPKFQNDFKYTDYATSFLKKLTQF